MCLAASDGVGWESRKEEPSIFRLQQQIVKSRYTRKCTITEYFRLCAILRQTPNPKPQTLNPKPQTLNPKLQPLKP